MAHQPNTSYDHDHGDKGCNNKPFSQIVNTQPFKRQLFLQRINLGMFTLDFFSKSPQIAADACWCAEVHIDNLVYEQRVVFMTNRG